MPEAKDNRELAFIRDLDINQTWTRRFTDLADQHVDLATADKILYVNAGTGDHCIALEEKSKEGARIFALCEDGELLRIAQDKAAAVRSAVEVIVDEVDESEFDLVITDASLTNPKDIADTIASNAEKVRDGGVAAILVPSAGSFGEIFSLIWEVLFGEDLGEHGAAAEQMVSDIPTISAIEEMAVTAGLTDIKIETAIEVFEYTNGTEFIETPLIADFLLPAWLKTMSAEERELVRDRLSKLIDSEDGELTFRFTVKATLLMGTKRQ